MIVHGFENSKVIRCQHYAATEYGSIKEHSKTSAATPRVSVPAVTDPGHETVSSHDQKFIKTRLLTL